MESIEKSGCILKISEYGELKRQYHDTDYDRFMSVSKTIIAEHLDKRSKQKEGEVRNITIHLYTY